MKKMYEVFCLCQTKMSEHFLKIEKFETKFILYFNKKKCKFSCFKIVLIFFFWKCMTAMKCFLYLFCSFFSPVILLKINLKFNYFSFCFNAFFFCAVFFFLFFWNFFFLMNFNAKFNAFWMSVTVSQCSN